MMAPNVELRINNQCIEQMHPVIGNVCIVQAWNQAVQPDPRIFEHVGI